MLSRMVIDRIEGDFAVCEIEDIDFNNPLREKLNPLELNTFTVDILLDDFHANFVEVEEQGEYLVYYEPDNKENVTVMYKL